MGESALAWSLEWIKACQTSGIWGALLELVCFGGGVVGGCGLEPPIPMKEVLMMIGSMLLLSGR